MKRIGYGGENKHQINLKTMIDTWTMEEPSNAGDDSNPTVVAATSTATSILIVDIRQ